MADHTLQWGSNVRAARAARGMSVDEFRRRLGVSQATVSRWETGVNAPKDLAKIRIAEILGADVGELFPLARQK